MPVPARARPSPRILDVARYVAYADAFGWTPDQVDDLPLAVEPLMLPVFNLIREVRDELSR